jgi:D-isomer specific 2-hydroxyacid dehydrogenase, NAD binding domain
MPGVPRRVAVLDDYQGVAPRVGLAFGMDVVAWSPHLTDQRAGSAGIRRVDKDQLLSTADIVTIHMVLSDRTRGLISARELDAMKPTSLLVDTSRTHRRPVGTAGRPAFAANRRRRPRENYRVF